LKKKNLHTIGQFPAAYILSQSKTERNMPLMTGDSYELALSLAHNDMDLLEDVHV